MPVIDENRTGPMGTDTKIETGVPSNQLHTRKRRGNIEAVSAQKLLSASLAASEDAHPRRWHHAGPGRTALEERRRGASLHGWPRAGRHRSGRGATWAWRSPREEWWWWTPRSGRCSRRAACEGGPRHLSEGSDCQVLVHAMP